MSGPRRARPGGLPFSIVLPPDWLVLDLDGERIPVQVERLLTEAAGRDHGLAAHRGMLERQIRTALREVRAGELSLCAMLSRVVDDVLPLSATLTVALRDAPADAGAVVSQLRRLPGARVGEFTVPAVGAAVRAVYRSTAGQATPGSPLVEAAVCQYFIPAPRGSRVAVITAATPVLVLAEQFEGLFDEVARSFAFEPDADRAGTRR